MIKATMVSGEVFDVTFTIKENDAPEDITSYECFVELRAEVPNGIDITLWKDGDAQIFRDNAAGVVRLLVSPVETNGYNFKIGYLDLLLIKEDKGRRSDTVQITLHRGVTR